MFWLIAINFSQKSHHFSLLYPTSPCELSEREVTSPSNLKVVRALVLLMFLYISWWMCSIFIKDGKILHLYENDHKLMIYKYSKQNNAKRTAVFSFYLVEHLVFCILVWIVKICWLRQSACAFQVITHYFLNNGQIGTPETYMIPLCSVRISWDV